MIKWAMDIISNFRLHLAVISLPAMLTGALVIKSSVITVFFAVIFLLVLFPICSWKRQTGHQQHRVSQWYSITSFNIEWNAPNQARSLAYINESDADILVLQEVTEPVKQKIGKQANRFPYQLGEGHSHVMVLSRYQCQLVEYLPWPGKFKQRAMHLICKLPEYDLHVFAIHLQVTRNWNEVLFRDQQLNVLINAIRGISQPVILVGDFNAATGSNVLRMIEQRLGLYSRASLLDYKCSWPVGMGFLGLQIDHFYSSRNINMQRVDLGPVLDSDHRPVTTKFGLVCD